MIRGTDLQGKRIVTEAGEKLGHVEEIHIRDGRVTELVCGPGGYLQRFLTTRRGRAVRWDRVVKITAKEVVVRG